MNSGSPSTDQIVPWFVGGLFALMISSIGFGQEGRSASLLYSLPITAGEVLRAKLFVSLLLAMTATLGLFAFVTALSRPPPIEVAENLVVAIAITAEEVMIGTAFGARYPDFQERPRPRFVDPVAILMMMLAGMTILFVTAAPSLVGDAVTSLPGLGSKLQSLFLVSTAFAVAVTALAYGWAKRETVHLLGEFTG